MPTSDIMPTVMHELCTTRDAAEAVRLSLSPLSFFHSSSTINR